MPAPWYNVKAKATDSTKAHIIIDGEIGYNWWDDSGVESSKFMNSIKAMGELTDIVIDINSPGGSVADGITIANYLREHKATVTVNVLGQASSIASVISSAADKVYMGLGSWGLIHDPWTVAVGNADQLRAMANDLDTLKAGIMDHYVARCGTDQKAKLEQLIKGEAGDGTLLSAQDWVDLGLADGLLNDVQAAASMTGLTEALAHAKAQALEKYYRKPDEETPADTSADQSFAALTLEEIKAHRPDLVAALQPSSTDIQAKVDEAVAAERTRTTSIMNACNTANQPQLMAKLVENGMNETQAGEYILDVAAASGDRGHIFNSHTPDGKTAANQINTKSVYDRYNRKSQGK